MAPGIHRSEDSLGPHVLEVVPTYAQNVPQSDGTGSIIPDTLLGQRRRGRILVIGLGAAAINLIHVSGTDPSNEHEIQCHEKNPEVGGTWYENRCPGCACDIPSVNDQFSWHPKPDWSRYPATAPEILGGVEEVCQKHGLYPFARLSPPVCGARWNGETGRWKIEVQPDGDPAAAFDDEGEIITRYIEKSIVTMQTQDLVASEPRQEAAVDHVRRHRERSWRRTAGRSPGRSWVREVAPWTGRS